MKKILEYIKPLYLRMLIGFLIKLAGTVMDLAIPWILAHMIDEVVPTGDRGAIFLWGIAMAACAVIALLGNVIANRRASAVSRDATRRIRHDLYEKIEHLSARQLDEVTIPSLISRLRAHPAFGGAGADFACGRNLCDHASGYTAKPGIACYHSFPGRRSHFDFRKRNYVVCECTAKCGWHDTDRAG